MNGVEKKKKSSSKREKKRKHVKKDQRFVYIIHYPENRRKIEIFDPH